MYKIIIQILSSIAIAVVSEILLDRYFRKSKAQLKLSNFKNEK